MAHQAVTSSAGTEYLEKAPTGISGIDEITGGGLPRDRTTLVCGGPGCGKTLLAAEFLVRGAQEFGEPGVFIAFEESKTELAKNVASLGFDLADLVARRMLAFDHPYFEHDAGAVIGPYSLDGLFARLQYAISRVGARRVVLDAVDVLFSGLPNPAIVRTELQRLFRWVRDHDLTAIVTAEQGTGAFTRSGLEEYVADCVILLDHRVIEQVSTRHFRIVKYRGTSHGTNEYPFLIGEQGIVVFPITSLELDYDVSTEHISSGIPDLDAMLGSGGYFRGSTVLVSGTAGSGKSSIAAAFADAACRRGERCLFVAFEEAPRQIMRNMRSIDIDLEPWLSQGLLHFHADRPTFCGLELHLARITNLVLNFAPAVVIVDPISSLVSQGATRDVKAMLTRMIDLCKQHRVTALFTTLTLGGQDPERTEVEVSSVADLWLLLRNLEQNGERNRGLYVLKARGMAHSNQIREFLLSNRGISLVETYLGAGAVLTGTARLAQEAREQIEAVELAEERERRERELTRRRQILEAQIAALRADLAFADDDLARLGAQERQRTDLTAHTTGALRRLRLPGKKSTTANNATDGEP